MKTVYMIDGGFLIKKYEKAFPNIPLTAKYVSDFVIAFNALHNQSNPIFRIFYYDCKPFDGTEKKPVSGSQFNFRSSRVYSFRSSLLDGLKFSTLFSVRLGSIVFRGWNLHPKAYGKTTPLVDDDYIPNFEQKGVDIKIGLDMAWTTINKNAERIVLIASDADFVPVMKFARVHGLQVTMGTLGHKYHPTLREHCDFFVDADLPDIHPAVATAPNVSAVPAKGSTTANATSAAASMPKGPSS